MLKSHSGNCNGFVSRREIYVSSSLTFSTIDWENKMAQLRINANESFTIDVTVRESDEYTEAIYIRLDRHYVPEEIYGCNELFLTPNQVEQLGQFLIRQADEIRRVQNYRYSLTK